MADVQLARNTPSSNIYKSAGQVKNFQDLLNNLFQPLFEVTIDPTKDPKLHKFLLRVRTRIWRHCMR